MGLVIALNKGRIFEECLPLLAACEIQPSEDPSRSRKLIFDSVSGGHKLIVTRSADVPTYVENGVEAATPPGTAATGTVSVTGVDAGTTGASIPPGTEAAAAPSSTRGVASAAG